MEAYLDNAATTQVFPEVREIVMKTMDMDYGNPSAMHMKGVEAERYIRTAKDQISAVMKVDPKEIIFTSGGTESNNMALIGTAMANHRSGKHIITTKIEHPSVYNPMAYLEEQGYEITYLNVNQNGLIDLDELRNSIREDTILVSMIYVNNEIGAIQPIKEIGALIKKINKNTLFHVDAIQAFGKIAIYPKRMNIDLLSVSGHKIHGPKGIGFLFIKDKIKINPIIFGGGQQLGIRSGTENVPGIAGIGLASQLIYKDHDSHILHMEQLKQRLIDGIANIEDTINNSGQAPHLVSISFKGIRSEVLLHALEEHEVYVSAGSACAASHKGASSTLQAIGLEKECYESTIRFSLSIFTTPEQIDDTIKHLMSIVPALRRYTRK